MNIKNLKNHTSRVLYDEITLNCKISATKLIWNVTANEYLISDDEKKYDLFKISVEEIDKIKLGNLHNTEVLTD